LGGVEECFDFFFVEWGGGGWGAGGDLVGIEDGWRGGVL